MAFIPIAMMAYDCEVDGIYYHLNTSDNTASVTKKDYNFHYSGTVTIPASIVYNSITYSVTSIGYSAFSGSSGLTSVTIPSSVTSIWDSAFDGCSGLASIIIPEGVTSILYNAFYGCAGLTSVTIPNSVTSIGVDAFEGCTSLPIENNIRYADTYLVEAVDKTQSTYTIKPGTRFIGSDAFSDCSGLTSLSIPSSVTSIGEDAF